MVNIRVMIQPDLPFVYIKNFTPFSSHKERQEREEHKGEERGAFFLNNNKIHYKHE